jgi:hypothetical protein
MKDVCEHGNTLSGSMKAGTLFTKFLWQNQHHRLD